MRRADDVRQAKQRAFGRGLDFEHVEAGTGDMAGLDGIGKRCLIHQTATGAVDDANAGLRLGDVVLAENAAGLVGHRHVQRDEISARQELVQLDLFDTHFLGTLGRQEGVIGDDMHAEPNRLLADDAADIASADDAQRLAGDLDAHELRLFPLAGLGRGVGLRQLAGNGEHERDGMFSRRDGIAEGRVHHDDAALGGSRNVDIVDADAGAADDLEIGRSGDQLFRRLGGGTDGEAIIVADDLGELFLVLAELRLEVHFNAAITEDLDGGFREFIGYENARCHDEASFREFV